MHSPNTCACSTSIHSQHNTQSSGVEATLLLFTSLKSHLGGWCAALRCAVLRCAAVHNTKPILALILSQIQPALPAAQLLVYTKTTYQQQGCVGNLDPA